jgi:hypothetical protein
LKVGIFLISEFALIRSFSSLLKHKLDTTLDLLTSQVMPFEFSRQSEGAVIGFQVIEPGNWLSACLIAEFGNNFFSGLFRRGNQNCLVILISRAW